MDSGQAGGYIFESVVAKLIKKSGYVRVQKGQLNGRGASHQIDVIGALSIPTPFVYPIRLLCEAKHYTASKVELSDIRNYIGVIKDISENYFVRSAKDRGKKRYTDVGCYFSIGPYRISAQNYAWAHNIFMVSFSKIDTMNTVSDDINHFVADTNNIQGGIKEMIREFWRSKGRKYLQNELLLVGVLNNSYPVIIKARSSILPKLQGYTSENDIIVANKTSRHGNAEDTETSFDIWLGDDLNETVELTIPNVIARRLIHEIDRSAAGDKIFEIDIPVIKKARNFLRRRMIKLDVRLQEKKEYLEALEISVVN
ncbi:MAG: restriction endonuclease [Candidatus Falkowbacteria bacterium]